jgi:hypothetical protein
MNNLALTIMNLFLTKQWNKTMVPVKKYYFIIK